VRVALVSPYDLGEHGGVQSHVVSLASALRSRGDEVVMIAPGGGRSAFGGYAGTGRSLRVPFNGSVAPIGPGVLSAARTRRYLDEIRPDVVHVHEPLVPAVGLAASRCSVAPVVATFHAWSAQVRTYRMARPLGRRVLGGLAATIAVSRAAAGYHGTALGIPDDRFEIVPNGVDTGRFAGVPASAAEAAVTDGGEPHPSRAGHDGASAGGSRRETLLFVGRLEPRKGLSTLLRAVVHLRVERPGLRLVVVGEGPERERCEASMPASLHDHVSFLGRVSDRDLVAAYAAADLYVSPALGGESFGIVLLEAMAAGRPVVASDIPGYRSVVTPDHDGVLVPPADPAALAGAIAALLDDPQRRGALVAAGRHTAADHDWEVVAERIRDIYTRVRRTG
jgi:phosphatidyl-myo-inositol alpha-mannosyltransferase